MRQLSTVFTFTEWINLLPEFHLTLPGKQLQNFNLSNQEILISSLLISVKSTLAITHWSEEKLLFWKSVCLWKQLSMPIYESWYIYEDGDQRLLSLKICVENNKLWISVRFECLTWEILPMDVCQIGRSKVKLIENNCHRFLSWIYTCFRN